MLRLRHSFSDESPNSEYGQAQEEEGNRRSDEAGELAVCNDERLTHALFHLRGKDEGDDHGSQRDLKADHDEAYHAQQKHQPQLLKIQRLLRLFH